MFIIWKYKDEVKKQLDLLHNAILLGKSETVLSDTNALDNSTGPNIYRKRTMAAEDDENQKRPRQHQT